MNTNPHQSTGAGNPKGSERDPKKSQYRDTISKFLNRNQKTDARGQERKSPTKTSDRSKTGNPEHRSQQIPQKPKKQAGIDIPMAKGTGKKSPPVLGDQNDTSDIPPKPPDPNNKPHLEDDSNRGDKEPASPKGPVPKSQITEPGEPESESSGNEQAPETGALRQGQRTSNRYHLLSEANNDWWDVPSVPSVNDIVKGFESRNTPCEAEDGEETEPGSDGEPGKGKTKPSPKQGQEVEKKRKRRSVDPNVETKKHRQNVNNEKKTMKIPVMYGHRPEDDEVTEK